MANTKGTRLMLNQAWDEKYPGWINCGNKKYRKPFLWKTKPANRYALEVECSYCKKLMLQDIVNNKKSINAFCSKECKAFFLKTKSKGNKIIKKRTHGDGHHVLIKNHEHHRADRHGNVYEHILIAEEKLKRPIQKNEIVHHINCVKNDNRPDNLFICSSTTEHFLIHGSLNRCVDQLLKLEVLIFNKETKKYEVKI